MNSIDLAKKSENSFNNTYNGLVPFMPIFL
jgi:hypothetical protein